MSNAPSALDSATRPRGGPKRPDLISGPIAPSLIAFSLPLLASNGLQSLSMTVNAAWISHVLGPTALTATVNSQILMMLLMGAVMGVGLAGSIMVAQAFGARNQEQMKRVVGSCFTFFVVASILLAIVLTLSAPLILHLMSTPPAAAAQAVVFLRFTCLSMPVSFFFLFATMLNRGVGDSQTPFQFSAISAVISFALTPFLITGWLGFPRLGIGGAVIATAIAQCISLVLMFRTLAARGSPIVLRRHEWHYLKPDWAVLNVMFSRGLPMGLQMFVMSSSAMAMLSLVNAQGDVVAAGYGAAQQLWAYMQMPAMAIGASVSSMVAQNIGANRWDRVNSITLSAVLMGLATTSTIVVVLYALGDIPLRLFLPLGGPRLDEAREINYYVLWSFVPFSVTFALMGVVRATGATLPPTIILLLSMWVIRVPFAHVLEPIIGASAIWWSFPLGTVVSATLALAYYRFGGWRKRRMLNLNLDRQREMRAEVAAEAAALVEGGPIVDAPVAPASATATQAAARAAAAPVGDPIAVLREEIDAMRRRLGIDGPPGAAYPASSKETTLIRS